MTILLYFAGLIIAITAFLYFLSLYEDGKEKIGKLIGSKPEPVVEPRNVVRPPLGSIPPGSRICPLCRSTLSKYEALYASQEESPTGVRILIHGCRYCYKPDENPDRKKRSIY
ncbi:MAG: hypothetical protein GY754_20330 [bacterium]|nr:hypothetical protein [bacterium]